MKKLKDFNNYFGHDTLLVGEFFKGYGSQSMSLDEIGVPNRVVVGSEIDPDAIISYASARHSQEELDAKIDLTDDEIKQWLMDRNIGWDFQKQKSSIPRMKKDKLHKLYNSCILENEVGDISIIDPTTLPNFDLMTYSFPCTDVSVAGKQEGLIKGQTRSGLLWECEKIISVKKPKILLMENVKNLVSKKFKPDFDKWCEWLESQGYTNYWQVLNAKDYGVPQNRERVFMISILGEHEEYIFPQKQKLDIRLKDILEKEVDEKYYIDNEASNKLIEALLKKGFIKDIDGVYNSPRSREYQDYKDPKLVIQHPCDSTLNTPSELDVVNCITARYDSGIQNYKSSGVAVCEETLNPKRLGNIYGDNFGTGYAGNVWDKEYVSPTLTTMQGGGREPMICEQRSDEGLRTFKDNICGTLRTIDSCGDKRVLEKSDTYRIRKLTPKECFRLMGVSDTYFDRIKASGISNSQLYKQAGNSIVRNCLDAIFTELFFEKENF